MKHPERRPAVPNPPHWHFPAPQSFWLDNGLEVLLCHRRGQHVASVCLSFDIPLTLEPTEREGVATITQRCVDEGTRQHPGATFSAALENIGASLDGHAGLSASQFYLDVPIPQLGEALSLLAEAVCCPELDSAQVERHCELRHAEIIQTLASSAQTAGVAFRQACIPPRFRASRLAGGNTDTVAAITARDVRAFHSRYYRPEGATLIITGDLDPDAVQLAARAFGSWTVEGNVNPEHASLTADTPKHWLIDRPAAVQADVRLGDFGIDRTDARWADLQVANVVLGGMFLSRLNRVLREERGYTYGIQLTNQAMRNGGLLSAHGAFRTEVAVEAVNLAAQLLDVAHEPLTADETSKAVRYILGSAPLRYSTAQGVTQALGGLVAAGLSAEFINSQAYALSQVTAASATEAFAELLPHNRLSLVIVGNAEELSGPLADSGWAPERHQL